MEVTTAKGEKKTLPIPKIKLMGDHIWLLPDVPPQKTAGGLIIPEMARNKSGERELLTGYVVAIGPGWPRPGNTRSPMPDVKIGDWVAYYKYGTQLKKLDDVEYVSMHEESVHAVLER